MTDKSSKPQVVVSIINNMPFIQTAFFESIIPLMFESAKTMDIAWLNHKAFPVDFARNQVAKGFLENPKYKDMEWLFFMDIDMTFPVNTLKVLMDDAIKNDRKVVSGVYFKRNLMNEVVGWKYDYNHIIVEPVLDGSVQEVEIIGMGCALIHRSVLEKIGYPWFQYGALHENLETVSTEDIHLCVRCRELGIPIYMNTAVTCGHIMSIENVQGQIKVISLTDKESKGTLEDSKTIQTS